MTSRGVLRAEPWTPRALGPAGSTLLSTVTDVLRFARTHLDDPSLEVLRASEQEIRIHAWFDAWCLGWARFDWGGGRVWLPDLAKWTARRSPAGAGTSRRGRPAFQLRHRASPIPIDLSPGHGGLLRHRGSTASTRTVGRCGGGKLSRFAGVYAWPDRRWDVTATRDSLLLYRGGRTIEALPLDDHTFLIDRGDPDTPTATFAGFDDEGRPAVVYDMLWGLPRT